MTYKSTTTLKCLIIDDEPDSHLVLQHHLSQIPWLSLAGNIYNAVEALVEIPASQPDLIFLDVNMPNLSGLQLLDMLPSMGAQVILTTAYSKYAMDGYDFDIADFLLKPATFERFLKAVNKVRINHDVKYGTQIGFIRADSFKQSSPIKTQVICSDQPEWKEIPSPVFGSSHATLRVEKTLHRVPYENIIFIESLKNYVNVHTFHECLTTRGSLAEFGEKLPASLFLRTHKSYIINRAHALLIEGNEVVLENDYRVMISKADRLDVLKSLAK